MNELTNAGMSRILWSDSDSFRDQASFNTKQFRNIIESYEKSNEILVYGNIEIDGEKHNSLVRNDPDTLADCLKSQALDTTWFLDENNDLWCREYWKSGTNYYLFREFNTDDEILKLKIKLNLLADSETFDYEKIYDYTASGSNWIIQKLSITGKLKRWQT